jgi:hypothetical protein
MILERDVAALAPLEVELVEHGAAERFSRCSVAVDCRDGEPSIVADDVLNGRLGWATRN